MNSKNKNDNSSTSKCFKSVLYVSIVFLLFQSICNTQLGIVSQFTHQNGNSWAGPLSTSLLFAGSAIGSLYNKYIATVSYKLILFLGSFGYTIFIGLAVIFLKVGFSTNIQIILLVGSFIAGLIVSAFYNGQFNYINTCSEIDNQKTKYFGLNMAISQSSNILGNAISTILIKPLGQFTYAVTMDIAVFVISLFFLFAKNYKYKKDSTSLLSTDIKRNQHQNFVKNQIVQINKSERNSENLNQAQSQNIRLLSSNSTSSKFQQKCPYLLFFCFAFSGIMISFVFCQLSVIFYRTFPNEEKEQLNRITFIAFMIEGVGQFLGGLTIVFFSKYFQKIIFAYIINGSVFLLSIACIYIGSHMQSFSILAFFSFIIGFCDCFGFVMALSIAGKWHQNGLTMFNFGQSMTVAVSAIMIAFLQIEYLIIWSVLIHILSAIGLITYRNQIEENKKQQQKNVSYASIIQKEQIFEKV